MYPKSNRIEAHFPFIGSIAIPCSREYSTSGLTSWGNYRDPLRHPPQVYMNIHSSKAARRKFHAPHIISRWELIPCLWLKRWAMFPQAPQVEFSLRNRYVRGTLCFLSQVECTARSLTQKKAGFPCSGLKIGSCFMSQDEGISESPVETLEKAVGLQLI